jgi:hypothetical protein
MMSCKRCGSACVGTYCEQCAYEIAGRTPPPRQQDAQQIARETGVDLPAQHTRVHVGARARSRRKAPKERDGREDRLKAMPSGARKIYDVPVPIPEPRGGKARTVSERVTKSPKPKKKRREWVQWSDRDGSVWMIPTPIETDRRRH